MGSFAFILFSHPLLDGGQWEPVPLRCCRPLPGSGGQCAKMLQDKLNNTDKQIQDKQIIRIYRFHPRSACGFTAATTWPQKLLEHSTAFCVPHTGQLLGEERLISEKLQKCCLSSHLSGWKQLAPWSPCWTFPAKSQGLDSLGTDFIWFPFWD